MNSATVQATCGRCGGSKKFAVYGHVANGVCFECNGSGKVAVKLGGHVAPVRCVDPAQARQSFINAFKSALRSIREEGKSWLNEPEAIDPRSGRTERQALAAKLAAKDCPADVRERAVAAFAALGVAF